MAKLKRSVITNKGFEALRKSIAQSKKMNFTRLVASDTIYNDSTNITTITTINNIKQSISISEVKEIENNKIKVTGVFKNTGLNTGYAMNTIALYGNVEGETEILFSVTRAEVADYMPATNGINVSTITIEIVLVLSENANISVSLDTSALVTTGMLDSYVKKSWGFLGQPAGNLNVVLTDKTNVWGAQVYRAYTPRGEFKGELRFDNNNLYTNYVNTNDNGLKKLKRVITENDVYLDDFNTTNKRLIQTNLATGVTYVSKELSFYGKNERGEFYALENRIGVDENGEFRVRQKERWSKLITSQIFDDKAYLGTSSTNDSFINSGAEIPRIGKILENNTAIMWIPNYINSHAPNKRYNGKLHFHENGNLYFASQATNNHEKKVLIETDKTELVGIINNVDHKVNLLKSYGYLGEINNETRAVRTNGHHAWTPHVIEMRNPQNETTGMLHTNKHYLYYKVIEKNNNDWIRVIDEIDISWKKIFDGNFNGATIDALHTGKTLQQLQEIYNTMGWDNSLMCNPQNIIDWRGMITPVCSLPFDWKECIVYCSGFPNFANKKIISELHILRDMSDRNIAIITSDIEIVVCVHQNKLYLMHRGLAGDAYIERVYYR